MKEKEREKKKKERKKGQRNMWEGNNLMFVEYT